MSEKKPFLRAAGVVGAITLLSRVLGLARDMVLAAVFGASRVGDIFLIAFELPNLARRILGEGSLSAFIVPIFSKVRTDEGEEAGWKFASNALTTVGLFSLVLMALGILLSRPLFSIFGYGYVERADWAAIELGTRLTRIMFPFLALLALSSILMGLCHSLRRFTTPALGSVMLNITMIGAGLLFWELPDENVFAQYLAVSVVLGAGLRLVIMLPTLAGHGYRYQFRLKPDSPRMKRLYMMMLPALYGLAVVQVNISISRAFATWLGEGYVPCLVFSNRLIQLPLAIIASALATAILPQITAYWIEKREHDLQELGHFAYRLVFILFMPAMMGLIALGFPIVRVLFERSEWTLEASERTYWAILFYAPGLIAWGMLRILTPIFYAQQDVKTPVWAAAASMVASIALNLLVLFVEPLRTSLAHGGLALATTLGAILNMAILLAVLKKRGLPTWDLALTWIGVKTLTASVVMAGAVWLGWRMAAPWVGGSTIRGTAVLAVLVPSGAVIYGLLAMLFRVPDLDSAWRILKRRGRK
ncbi:murein biosynthesis integral membrane protein MurJ [bacterium]|nr:murein biosynthesis integral membrane protein MurJ [bacterium]